MSLRTRLSLFASGALLAGLLLSSLLAYALFVRQQAAQLRALLRRDLARLEALLADPSVGTRLLTGESGGLIEQLVTREGRVLLPVGAGAPLPEAEAPTSVRWRGGEWLVLSGPWRGPQGATRGTLRVGLPLDEALAARRALLRSLLAASVLIALLTLTVHLGYLRRAFAPLTSLARQARRIDPANPEPTELRGPDDEVADVARALDDALGAIRDRQAAERASLAEVAHELAAPLTLVGSHLEGLARERPDDRRLLAARDAALELLYTSQDLLTLSRGELERHDPMELLRFDAIARRIAQEYPGVRLGELATAEVVGNPQRLAQAVRNLVRNAIQAAGRPEGVELRLALDGDAVVLEVHDDGPGMNAEDRRRAFDRFWSRKAQGTGVGLSVVAAVATQHAGEATVASEPGRGSCFSLRLPRLETRLE